MPLGTVGRMGPGMRQVVGFGDQSTGRGTFGGKYGALHCNQWGLCSVTVPKCVNHASCSLGWCMGSAEALVYYMGGLHHARRRGGFGSLCSLIFTIGK